MAYIYFCNNPKKLCHIGDCVIRAISKALNISWESAYIDIAIQGYLSCDMPSSNNVWGSYLYSRGFRRHAIPDKYSYGYTVEDFCKDHPKGTYILATGTHVVTCISGNWYDTWNSAEELPAFYWEREEY